MKTVPGEELLHRWESIRTMPDSGVAALYLLRELEREAHRERSKELTVLVRSFQNVVPIEPLPSLPGFLKMDPTHWKKIPDCPSQEELELSRPDRAWERSIAALGLSLGWVWVPVEKEMNLTEITAFHEAFEKSLFPHALVLIVKPSGEKWVWWTLRKTVERTS